jgi:hypothetical protein
VIFFLVYFILFGDCCYELKLLCGFQLFQDDNLFVSTHISHLFCVRDYWSFFISIVL